MNYNTPKSWSEINIEKYIALNNLYKNEQDEIELTLQRLCILLELSYSDVENIPLSEYNKIKEDLAFLNKEPNQTKYSDTIILGGVEYKMIDINRIKLGEFIDLEYYQKDLINNLSSIICVLYQNNGKRPDYNKVNKEVDIETALSAFFFIYLVGMSCSPSVSQDYSMLDLMMMEMKKIQNQLQNEESLEKPQLN
mgnify:CR=1 FL=1